MVCRQKGRALVALCKTETKLIIELGSWLGFQSVDGAEQVGIVPEAFLNLWEIMGGFEFLDLPELLQVDNRISFREQSCTTIMYWRVLRYGDGQL